MSTVHDQYLLAQAQKLGYTAAQLDDFARRWAEKLLHAKTDERKQECQEGLDNCKRAAMLLKQQPET